MPDDRLELRCQRCGTQMEMRDPAPGAAWAPQQFWVCPACSRHFWTTHAQAPGAKPADAAADGKATATAKPAPAKPTAAAAEPVADTPAAVEAKPAPPKPAATPAADPTPAATPGAAATPAPASDPPVA